MFPQKLFPAPARGAVTTFLRTHRCNRCHHELKRLTFIHFSFCKFQFFKSHPLDDYCVPGTGLPRCISFNPGNRTLRLILLFPFYRWRKRGSGLRVMPRSYSLCTLRLSGLPGCAGKVLCVDSPGREHLATCQNLPSSFGHF